MVMRLTPAAKVRSLRTHAAKPVFALSSVKNDLQQAETEGKESDAPQSDGAGAVLADIRRVVHEGADH